MKSLREEQLGQVGEKIIRNTFSEMGYKVIDSIDIFDKEKDFYIVKNNRKILVENKTQVPYVQKCALTINQDQRKKCWAVGKLTFVTVPPNTSFEYAGYIYDVNIKKAKITKYTTKGGEKMIAIPILQPAVKVIRKLTKKELTELQKYKVSKY